MKKLTKQQFRERYANIKVYVDGKGRELQERFFKAGFSRENGRSDIIDSESPFLFTFFNSQKEHVFFEDSGMRYFAAHKNREVKAEEILNIEIIEDCPFKLKDEIVARISDGDTWFHGYFSSVNTHKECFYKYVLSGGLHVSQCLPFNEKTAKLIGTTDDYEEDEE